MPAVMMAKTLMKIRPSFPMCSEESIGELSEVFSHKCYREADDQGKNRIRYQSSLAKYVSEKEYPWDHYFGCDIAKFLKNKRVLDLGCFTGGRGVAWTERYGISEIVGIDVREEFVTAATDFARQKGVRAKYTLAKGENLPFDNDHFDAILSFDVFEHVADLGATLGECHRVLRPGGILCAVFPSYYHPFEHHLALATRMPGLQYFFGPKTLVKAYYEVLKERGEDAQWYRRESPALEDWERGHRINGTTRKKFMNLIGQMSWLILHESRMPLGRVGRNVSKKKWCRWISYAFAPLTRIPYLNEAFLHRVTVILEKK